MDVLFINPGDAKKVYQKLADDYSAVETPTWALLLAESCRSVGYDVGILDVNAEKLYDEEVRDRILSQNPRLLCFVAYGQNPNSGTVNMTGASRLATFLKEQGIVTPISIVGSHVQALPYEVLDTELCFDIIIPSEGVYALRNLLKEDLSNIESLGHVKGIGFKKNGKAYLTHPEHVVPQEKMDIDLPGYAWDLLPYKERPLDLYRAHFWHAEYNHNKRSPFAAIYTSLGCNFKCGFCMINIVNRDDNEEIGVASNYAKMRYWSPEHMIKEFDKLADMSVESIRISDEMFMLNRKYYLPLCKLIKERGYGDRFRMWAYSRVDTIKNEDDLRTIREAGIKWLCLGIESADKTVRLEVTKGKFEDVDITEVIQKVHSADIDVMANYLVGLPGDTHETMKKTLDLSLKLCTRGWNLYAAMALPGSQLYKDAREEGIPLPDDYSGYSFHSYDTLPLPNESLTAAEVLKFRDEAFTTYHTYEPFLNRLEEKYGSIARNNVEEMTKIKLVRKILGD